MSPGEFWDIVCGVVKLERKLTKGVLAAGSPEDGFQFIDLSATSAEQKRQNRTAARSHVMRGVRKAQRRRRETATLFSKHNFEPSMPEEEANETTWLGVSLQTNESRDVAYASFAANIARSLNTESLSPTHKFMLEQTIGPLRTYLGKPTPALQQCIHSSKFDPRAFPFNRLGYAFLMKSE
jgi:hypothetical protein